MERIDGEPIDTWCARHGLRERLNLFRQVCTAVQYAHRNLVVHRDLKPSNILVTAEGLPKLLDFGIAKLLDDDSADERTRTQFRMLTPEYASPEQLLGEPITTASDVYSLGVLLYRLLTGLSPYATTADGKRNPVAQAITEGEITRPSLAALRKQAQPPSAADQQLARSLRGDLDAIVMQALRRQPADRYGSAEALGEDLQRHLDLLPVRARREGSRYLIAKFARRRWRAIAATAAALVTLIATVTFYTVQLDQRRSEAETARKESDRERANAEAISKFMVDLITQDNPYKADSKGKTLREVVEEAGKRAREELKDQPLAAANLLKAIAESLSANGEFHATEQLRLDTIGLYDSALGEGSEPAMELRLQLISDYANSSTYLIVIRQQNRTWAGRQQGNEVGAGLRTPAGSREKRY